MSELFGSKEKRKEMMKTLIRRIHEGEDAERIKREFMEVLKSTTPEEIAVVEQELIEEGLPREEVLNLCEVHLAVFQESLQKESDQLAPEGHPVRILMEEHSAMVNIAGMLVNASREGDWEKIQELAEKLRSSETHYLREENVLFPYLEKYGIKEPPAVMWMEHDRIRELKKRLYELVESKDESSIEELQNLSVMLSEMLSSHFFKENNVLFPMAIKVLSEQEWYMARKEFDDLGYCEFTPESVLKSFGTSVKEEPRPYVAGDGLVDLGSGSLTLEELIAILNTLPVDFTFVDKDDRVKYFNEPADRIFVRTRAVIGRSVQQCHPQKSLHVVNKILEDFKAGVRDSADFWINKDGRLIYIRYFPVRNDKGEYLGTLEVTQDVTEIKQLEGEKRLLS